MKFATALKILLVVTITAVSSGCLVEQTVTRNGEVEQEGYVIKRPIKEAIENTKEADDE